jgi:hypothetical protein
MLMLLNTCAIIAGIYWLNIGIIDGSVFINVPNIVSVDEYGVIHTLSRYYPYIRPYDNKRRKYFSKSEVISILEKCN